MSPVTVVNSSLTTEISDRYRRVLDRIAAAAISRQRDPAQIRLVVVSKGQPLERVRAVIQAGARDLGENYVEDAIERVQSLSSEIKLTWHMIGHVQSRKSRLVCEYFDWVHSVDSLKLAQRLDRFAGEMQKQLPVLLEFNVSGEETKFGFPAWQEERWGELLSDLDGIFQLNNLRVLGLMTIAPYNPDAEAARPYFQRLARLRSYLNSQFPRADLQELSMGMSLDFEVAVQEGATIVRIGEAILGIRPT